MRYKGIFIDADDTLFDFKAGERIAAGRVLEFLGISEPARWTPITRSTPRCGGTLKRA
jgi:FMN phosphatase YigB (HAD superfamily)